MCCMRNPRIHNKQDQTESVCLFLAMSFYETALQIKMFLFFFFKNRRFLKSLGVLFFFF